MYNIAVQISKHGNMYPQRNRDSLLALLLERGLQDQFPDLISRLALEDITIPNLRRELRWLTINEQEHKIHEHGDSWKNYGYGEKQVPYSNEPHPYAQEPEGGFTRSEKVLLQKIDRKYSRPVPPPLRDDFVDVTSLEARVAYSIYHAVGARLGTAEEFSDFLPWAEEKAKELGLHQPRFIIMDSDQPNISVLSLPRIGPTIFVSRNAIEVMDPDALKGAMIHEFGHTLKLQKEYEQEMKPQSLRKYFINAFSSFFRQKHELLPYRDEYSADALGAHFTSHEDMMRGIAAVHTRINELSAFSRKIQEAITAEKAVDPSKLPAFLLAFANFGCARHDLPGKDRANYFGDNKTGDRNPPTMWRFDALNEGIGQDTLSARR